jgi:hypothetical protein
LLEKIGESRHVHGVEEVDFEVVLVADIIPEEWNTLDQADMSDKGSIPRILVRIATI